jgi:ring-1,2-phenylacetyl-CoA epoxidase subunit PaaD
VLSPAWTTDWMRESGKQKLRAYGIAPPQNISSRINKLLFSQEENIECPQCHSTNTKLLSEFGSTACKALYQCNDCKEPFDYFKCH